MDKRKIGSARADPRYSLGRAPTTADRLPGTRGPPKRVRSTTPPRQRCVGKLNRRSSNLFIDRYLGVSPGWLIDCPPPLLGKLVRKPVVKTTSQLGVRMRRTAMLIGSVLLALGSLIPASAQTTGLIGGGLTALPGQSLGPNQLRNSGFETLSGSVPASWSTGAGWAVDQQVKHSGSYSYRATGSFVSATQAVALKQGIYKLSGWIRTQGISTGTTRGVRLQFDRRPALSDWKQTDLIGGTRDWTLFEVPDIVVSTDAVVTIRLENFNNIDGHGLVRRPEARGAEEPRRPGLHALSELPGHAVRRSVADHEVRPDRHASR